MDGNSNSKTGQRHTTGPNCLECQHCCRYEIIPIGDISDTLLELAYYKGLTMLWDPCVRMWMMSFYKPCQHHTDNGCKIYTTYRPKLCRTWICAYPTWMEQRYNILVTAGKRILKQKFGEIQWEKD